MLARGGAERFDGRVLALLQVGDFRLERFGGGRGGLHRFLQLRKRRFQPESAPVSGSASVCSSPSRRSRRCSSACRPRSRCTRFACSSCRPALGLHDLAARLAELLLPGAEGLLGLREGLFSASSFSRVSLTFCLAPPAREAHMWSAWVSCERCSRHASWARRSVCWDSRRLRVSSMWRSSDSCLATSALAE